MVGSDDARHSGGGGILVNTELAGNVGGSYGDNEGNEAGKLYTASGHKG